ncbi:hypothetical protein V2H45_25140 [Tumidithrix elongata RA019]|uniref:Uncharacterized protein n=1 Tax=Tumidithrix elongata BACA0141 TaxID=2716417 RepID=A0AAW9PZV0_9CYAN|nr:hypothetical protein [Tumidithrix elongata RA019]
MQISFIPDSFLAGIKLAIQNCLQAIASSFSNSNEIKVWSKTDWHGNTYWCVYDPKTGQTARFGSEIEVMAWIESHYYL